MPPLPSNEPVPGFEGLGFTAFTTTRDAGSFDLGSAEPAGRVVGRWLALKESLGAGASRMASAHQAHGDRILLHGAEWSGWLRDTAGADGHISRHPGTSMVVTIADCVPVFMAHPAGVAALLHSGWRGTAAGILNRGLDAFSALGLELPELRIHLGPAICGRCYEVGPDVYHAVTGEAVDAPMRLDLRDVLWGQARRRGAEASVSPWCTKCHNQRFFSHRAGDSGRQVAVLSLGSDPRRDH